VRCFSVLLSRIRISHIRKIYYRVLSRLSIDRECFAVNKSKLGMLKDIHNGKRCFIIGNGPSLNSNDLEKLKQEITFAFNKCYLIFNKTNWRPTYYISQDLDVLKEMMNESDEVIKNIPARIKFLPMDIVRNGTKYDYNNYYYFYNNRKYTFPRPPKFSSNISKVVEEGYTVTYSAIQMAVYMGFSEIYLLGIDHSYRNVIDPNGSIITDTSIKDYFSEEYKKSTSPPHFANLHMPELAYTSARKYCDNHGIKIYNSTRGGKLEVFDRKDFDILFND